MNINHRIDSGDPRRVCLIDTRRFGRFPYVQGGIAVELLFLWQFPIIRIESGINGSGD